MKFESITRSLLLCLLLGCPKNLLQFLTHASGDEVGGHTSLKGSPITATNNHQPEVTPKTPITLNVKIKKSTDRFDYTNQNGIGTYTAKEGFVFYLVKKDSDLIWEATKPSDYANKVVSDGLKFCASINNVTAYLANEAVIKLTKENKKWKAEVLKKAKEVEEKPKASEENDQSKVEVGKSKNENEGSDPKEEEGSEQKDPEESKKSQSLLTNLGSQPGKNAGGGSVEVSLAGFSNGPKDKELDEWSNQAKKVPDGQSQQSNQTARSGGSPGSQPGKFAYPPAGSHANGVQTYPKSGSGGSTGGNSISSAGGASLQGGSSGSQARSGSSTPLTPSVRYIDLDLTKTGSANEYYYNKVGDVETYTANDGFAIKSYSEGTDVKWTSDGTLYLKEVKKTKQTDGSYNYDVTEYNPNNTNELPKAVKLFTHDPSDDKRTKENDVSQFTVKNNDGMLECTFTAQAKCVKLVIDGKEVWKHGEENIQEYPKAIKIHKTERALVEFSSNTIFYTKMSDGSWDTNVYSTSSSSGSGNNARGGGVSGRPINAGRLAAMAEGKND